MARQKCLNYGSVGFGAVEENRGGLSRIGAEQISFCFLGRGSRFNRVRCGAMMTLRGRQSKVAQN